MFDKSAELFPIKNEYVFLTHCSISPLFSKALEKEIEISREHQNTGAILFDEYDRILDDLRSAAGELLDTSPDNLSFVKNTSEGLCMVANGYPFEPGDQVISYIHEYPANHYPWKLQEERGAELLLLPDRDVAGDVCGGRPCGWSMKDLEALVTDRTRIVAVSHVQFASGFGCDLKLLGEFCKARNIDLVIDAAQSLGSLPLDPEELHISAIAASGWKWLLGPVGTGLLYTSEVFREKLDHVMVGAEMMEQGMDYLDHAWQPHRTGKRFEYSTSPISLATALEVCIRELPLRYGLEAIRDEIFRLQDMIINGLNRERYTPVIFPSSNRSGILSMVCRDDPEQIAERLVDLGVVCSARGGYLRLAPHFYNSDDEIDRVVSLLS